MTPPESEDQVIGVGAVGVLPGEQEALMEELPEGRHFELVAFSDEGLPDRGPEYRPVSYYPDYNMMLQDPKVELVLVNGLLEYRRDLAVRALNAGRHVVLPLPFAETALGAERILKTALKQGLVATADCRWRDDPDLRALREALAREELGQVKGLFLFETVEPVPEPEESLVDLLFLEEEPETEAPEGLLEREGVALMDQLHLLAHGDVRRVNAHRMMERVRETEEGFMVYLALRSGGWAVGQATPHEAEDVPRWAAYTPHGTAVARDGRAVVTVEEQEVIYQAPADVEDFWDNLYAAVRQDAKLKVSPVDIVRAMKLHEAAIESVEAGEAVTI